MRSTSPLTTGVPPLTGASSLMLACSPMKSYCMLEGVPCVSVCRVEISIQCHEGTSVLLALVIPSASMLHPADDCNSVIVTSIAAGSSQVIGRGTMRLFPLSIEYGSASLMASTKSSAESKSSSTVGWYGAAIPPRRTPPLLAVMCISALTNWMSPCRHTGVALASSAARFAFSPVVRLIVCDAVGLPSDRLITVLPDTSNSTSRLSTPLFL